MKIASYESLQAEHAWMIISDQLLQRNKMLAKGILHMERSTKNLSIANRLIALRYHLKFSIQQLAQEAKQSAKGTPPVDKLNEQWRHIHQLLFLLRQVDTEVRRATFENKVLRVWLESHEADVYRSTLIHLN